MINCDSDLGGALANTLELYSVKTTLIEEYDDHLGAEINWRGRGS
jgi:hypothetical protein